MPDEFWSTAPNLPPTSWWYSIAVLPALIICVCVYLGILAVMVRRRNSVPVMFFWLLAASIPLILVLPSYYVSTAPAAAIARIGARPAEAAIAIKEVRSDLDRIATLGIVGVALAIVIVNLNLLVGSSASSLRRAVRSASRNITKLFPKSITQQFGAVDGDAAIDAEYGIIRVTRGEQQGTGFDVIHDAIIGVEEAAILFTDPIVSRQHARFEVLDNRAHIIDLESTNGTYIMRGDDLRRVGKQPLELQNGDRIYLGYPKQPAAVELMYELIESQEAVPTSSERLTSRLT